MPDYTSWITRAVEFTEGLRSLPGDIQVTVEVSPPINEAQVAALNSRLRLKLPGPIVHFLTTASAKCLCEYWWEPSAPLRRQLDELFPSKTFVFGGSSLCHWDKFDSNERGRDDTGEALQRDYPEDARFWLNSVPFYEAGDGDCLGLYVGTDWMGEEYPVVKLDQHGCGWSKVVAPSFDEFLSVWEELNYLHPCFLIPYLRDPITGYISPNSPKTEKLKALFRGKWRK